MTSSAPVNLADMDTVFMVPCCKRCGEMLQEQTRFCPLCGKDQSAAHGAGGSWLDTADAWLDAVPESGAAGGSEVPAPAAVNIAAAPNPLAVQASLVHAVPGGPAREAANSDFGLVRPSDLWQKEVLEREGPKRRPGSAVDRSRLVIGLMAVLIVLLLAALVHDNFFVEKRSEAGKARVFRAVERALSPGELNAAARALRVLDAGYLDDPVVQQLRDTYDRQVQEAAGMPKPRTDADPKASRPPEADEPAAAAPVPVTGMADPKAKECNEVLTALALCQK